jgi:chromosome partitioning protein
MGRQPRRCCRVDAVVALSGIVIATPGSNGAEEGDRSVEPLLTVEETARLLKAHPRTIQRWCKDGKLPCTRLNSKTFRIFSAELIAQGYLPGQLDGDTPAGETTAGQRPVAMTAEPMAATALLPDTVRAPVGDTAPGARQAVGARLVDRPRVIALANQKGGVGKTTTAVNLAAALGERGLGLLVIDLDPQANATSALTGREDCVPSVTDVLLHGVDPSTCLLSGRAPNVWVLPSNIGLADAEIALISLRGREFLMRPVVERLKGQFDIVVIDCPPSLGVLATAGLMAADEFVVPVRPHMFSAMGIRQLFNSVDELRDKLGHAALHLGGILINQGQIHRDGTPRGNAYLAVVTTISNAHPGALFKTVIPDAVAIEEAHQRATSVTCYEPTSLVAQAYRQLAEEVLANGRQ